MAHVWDLEVMAPALPGMYFLDNKEKTATVVVMWATVELCDKEQPVRHVIPITIKDVCVEWPVADGFVASRVTTSKLTTQVPQGFKTIR